MEGQVISFYEGKNFLFYSRCYTAPRVGETVTDFDPKTGIFKHYEVVDVGHGHRPDNDQIIVSVNMKFIKEQTANEE